MSTITKPEDTALGGKSSRATYAELEQLLREASKVFGELIDSGLGRREAAQLVDRIDAALAERQADAP